MLKVHNNTKVYYITVSGKDIVKSEMPLENAQRIIKHGKQSKSKKFDGFNLCVDNKYYFETVSSKEENNERINEEKTS